MALLGIDCGLTVCKAVIFGDDGHIMGLARRRIPQILPKAHHIERDMTELWRGTAAAISMALAQCGHPDIAAISVSAHGDGLYLLDRHKQPLGPGILSLDSRAGDIAAQWEADGTGAEALRLSGQKPHASAPAALLAWIKRHEPQRFAAIGHILSCKDWIRYCLGGTIGTDLTEGSTSFTNVMTQIYDPDILALFGLAGLEHALPAMTRSHHIIGQVTAQAAAQTGLTSGIPIAAGLHDVTASSLGIGGYHTDKITLVAGTYSINEAVSNRPWVDERWFCRNGLTFGEWNHMAISPASAANYDWFLDRLCAADQHALSHGQTIHELIRPEIEAALARPSGLIFHPYLYGSPHGPVTGGGFIGLRGWHQRGDLLRAVIEGIAFNHRFHVDALDSRFSNRVACLTGGISRSPLYAQIFANCLGRPVHISKTEEPAAWGAALCAGAGVGLYPTPRHDPRAVDQLYQIFTPNPATQNDIETRYRLHCDLATGLMPFWARIHRLENKDP